MSHGTNDSVATQNKKTAGSGAQADRLREADEAFAAMQIADEEARERAKKFQRENRGRTVEGQ